MDALDPCPSWDASRVQYNLHLHFQVTICTINTTAHCKYTPAELSFNANSLKTVQTPIISFTGSFYPCRLDLIAFDIEKPTAVKHPSYIQSN